jgi:hypothetical protein
VFEKRVLSRMVGTGGDVPGDRTELHNEKICNLFSSPNIITMNKLRRMKWVGHVARMIERERERERGRE